MEYKPLYTKSDGWTIGKKQTNAVKPLTQMEAYEACDILNKGQKKKVSCMNCGSPLVKENGGYKAANGRKTITYLCLNCGNPFSIDE